MSDAPGFDPEATMAGFEAKRNTRGTNVAPPGETATTSRRTRPRRAQQVTQAKPPFGSRRGSRVTYTVYLPAPLAERLDDFLHDTAVGRTSLGAIAVTAIREHWHSLHPTTPPTPTELFGPEPVVDAGPRGAGQMVRRVFYISSSEADAIELVRLQLGGLDLQQLHIAALELLLDSATPHDD